ncbi:MAG TPA: hypothetical protein VGA63_05585 [Geopsychrobacteraceae bacterium]
MTDELENELNMDHVMRAPHKQPRRHSHDLPAVAGQPGREPAPDGRRIGRYGPAGS